MKEKKQNKELHSLRAFFKETTKKQMKGRTTFVFISVVCIALFSCEKIVDILSLNNVITYTVNIDASTLKTKIVKVQTLAESVDIDLDTATSVSIKVFSNNKPQIIAVTDNDDHLLMMYRGPVNEGGNASINAHSTANALVSFNPLYGPVPSSDYDEMMSIFEASPFYQDYYDAISGAINNGIDLADSSNAHVVAMMYNLLRDINEQAFAGLAACDSIIVAQGSELNLFPILATENDSILTLRSSNNCPSYYGSLYDGDGKEIRKVSVPASGRYGFMDGFGSSMTPNSLGTPVNIDFSQDGLYTLELSCTAETAIIDFYVRFVNNILAALGADIDPQMVSAIVPLVRNAVSKMDIDITAVSSDEVMQLICEGYDVVLEYLRGQSDLLNNGEANWELGGTLLNRLNEVYVSIRSATEALLCTSWGIIEEEDNNDTGVSHKNIRRVFLFTGATFDKFKPVAGASLKYFSGNNQKGQAFTTLKHDIKVKMFNAYDRNGDYIHSNNRQVKFVATLGNGTFEESGLNEYVATTGITGIASARWTLGYGVSGNTQTCYAVVIDSIGNEVSNRVYFNALVSNKRYRISLCCNSANHNNYASQFDMDMSIVSNEEGTVDLIPTNGPQWDYDHTSERFSMTGTYNTTSRYTDMTIDMYVSENLGGWHFRSDRYQFTMMDHDMHVNGQLIYDGFDHGSPYGAGCQSYICIRPLRESEAPLTKTTPNKAPSGSSSFIAKKKL